MAEENLTPADAPKKNYLKLIGVILIVLLVLGGGIYLRKMRVEEHALSKNRIIAHRMCSLGKPIPAEFSRKVDVKLLEQDAAAGNSVAADTLKLLRNRQNARRLCQLGKPTPADFFEQVDRELLEKDAAAGNEEAREILELIANRENVLTHCQIGKPISETFLQTFNRKLTQRDATAGNNEMSAALALIKKRKFSQQLCALGKPFEYDFYEKVDREWLKRDGEAGFSPSMDILRLADMRIKATELTVFREPYRKGFFQQVERELLVKDAEAGNADMQYVWARINKQGRLVKRNLAVAQKFYKRAAEQNHAKAQCGLADMYFEFYDEFDEVDDLTLFHLYSKAANSGYHYGVYRYGRCYVNGIVENDDKKFLDSMRRAAELGDHPALRELGDIYFYGKYGEKKNMAMAEEFYLHAIELGNKSAYGCLKTLYLYQDLNSEEIDKKLTSLYKKRALAGNPYAMAHYGWALVSGIGVEKDQIEGRKWIRKAVSQDEDAGYVMLADAYRLGSGEERNFREAVKYDKIAAERGHRRSMYELGVIFYYGKGNVDVDYNQALKYLLMAEDLEDSRSSLLLAEMYMQGNGVKKNVEEAIFHLKRAFGNGDGSAAYKLGNLYLEGKLVEKDVENAMFFFNRGERLEDGSCMHRLAEIYVQGEVVKQDIEKGMEYYKMSAKAGNPEGLYDLATFYEQGKYGCEIDKKLALELYQKAAAKGNKLAMKAIKRLSKK